MQVKGLCNSIPSQLRWWTFSPVQVANDVLYREREVYPRMGYCIAFPLESSDSHPLLAGFNFHLGAQPHIERIQFPDGAFLHDAEGFVARIGRDLRFVNAEPLGQVAL